MTTDPRPNFAIAARWFCDIADRVPANAWDQPGLGEWDVRALVGHTSRSLITVDTYLDRPVEQIAIATPWDYYEAASAIATASPEAVVERGRAAGAALGDQPAQAIAALVERVVPRVSAADDPIIETIAGGMRLSAYLPTRTFELVVHGYDIASAIDLMPPPPLDPDTLAAAVALAGRIAIAAGSGDTVLRALTGRTSLPSGFTVV
jgi:hypothetical protein